MHIQPEIRGIAENRGEYQGGVRCDVAAVDTQLVDGFSAHTHCLGKLPLSQAQRHQELLGNHFTDADRLSFRDIHSLPHR